MLEKLDCYVTRVSIFLITVALIAGMVGCGPTQYKLTISSTEGGQVTIPGEDTFTYEEKRLVDLVAQAEEGYQFVNWTGNVTTIANVNATITTITVNGDYSITANFAPEISENLEIWDWYDLNAIRDNLSGSYILMNDLDSTTAGYEELASPIANGGKGWQPIGSFWSSYGFTGTFDGQGYEIRDLFINRPDEGCVGLFVIVDEGGHIENIGVVNATVTGYAYVCSLVGGNMGTVSNSYSTGNVAGEEFIGGLVGFNGGEVGTVSNSYSSANVTGYEFVGGLVGGSEGIMSNSYSTGSVTGERQVGGLVGENRGTVSDSYSTGNVTGDVNVGGLVGANEEEGTVSDSFWDIETSGQATSDGGTGKTTAQMKSIATFSGASWNIIAVAPDQTNDDYTWNIVDDETYPFLSWQS